MKPKSIVTDLVQSLYHALNVELSDKILETRDLKEFQKLSKEEQQEIIKMVFLLAQFVQKVCLDDNLSKYIALEFKNIISSIEEDLEFKKFYYKI